MAKNGFFPKKSCFFLFKKHFCHKMIFSYFLFCIKTIFNVKWTKKKTFFLKVILVLLTWKMFFFFILYGKKVTFAVKTTFWTKWLVSNDFFPYDMTFSFGKKIHFSCKMTFSFSFRIIRALGPYYTEKSHFSYLHQKSTFFGFHCKNRKKSVLHGRKKNAFSFLQPVVTL